MNQKNEVFPSRIKKFGKEVEKEFGLKYFGFCFHMDEGHGHTPTSDPDQIHNQDEIKNNYHAHCEFFNFDFITGKQPLRNLNRASGFTSRLQDIAFQHFKDLGYSRGVKKVGSYTEKTDKIDFLEKTIEKLSHEANQLTQKNVTKPTLEENQENNFDTLICNENNISYDVSFLSEIRELTQKQVNNDINKKSKKPKKS